MLHALRSSPSRLREDREAGFTLIEILVAMVLMTIIMSSLAVFFIGSQKSSSALRVRENATVVADQAMDKVHSIQATKLLTGRDAISEHAQWQSTIPLTGTVVGVDVSSMNEISDPAAVTGQGTDPTKAILPTVPQLVVANKMTYSVSTILGKCWIPRGGGACTKAPSADPVEMDRVIVAVNWPDQGNGCPRHICAYVIGSLISPLGDPTFNVNQVVIDTTPPSTPTLHGCTVLDDQRIQINAWSPSTDASGVSRYDIYEGTTPDFALGMAKDGSTPTTGPYTDTGLTPDQTYYFVVVALDTVGNQSGPQVPVGTVTNPPQPTMESCHTLPDTVPPTAPKIAAGTAATTNTTNFTWTAFPSTDDYKMGSYQVFRNGTLIQTVSPTTTTFTDTGLSPWVTYQYQVRAVDFFGNVSAPSNQLGIQTKDTSAPTVPSGLAAVAQPWPALQIDLNWNDSVDDVATTGYQVLRSITNAACPSPYPPAAIPAPWSLVGTPSTSAFSDTAGLAGSTKYYYCVYAHDAVPNYSAAAIVNASTPDKAPPSTPTGLSAPTKTATTLGLTWAASTDNVGVVGYNIYRNGSSTPVNGALIATTNFTDTGLTQLTSYTYTVKAYDAAGNVSAASTALVVSTLDGQAPTAPVLSTTGKTINTVALSWTPSSDNVGVTGYAVYRNGVFVANDPASPFTDTGLAPGTTYTYTVTAFDAAGNVSVASNSLPVTTLADTAAPTAVTGLKGTATAAKNTATVSWNASSDNVGVVSYLLYVNGLLYQTVASPALSYVFPSPLIANGQTYTFVVYAKDAAGNVSAASTPAPVSCKASSTGTVTCP